MLISTKRQGAGQGLLRKSVSYLWAWQGHPARKSSRFRLGNLKQERYCVGMLAHTVRIRHARNYRFYTACLAPAISLHCGW